MRKKYIHDALLSTGRAFSLRKEMDQTLVSSLREVYNFLQQMADVVLKNKIQKLIFNNKPNSSHYILNTCLIDLIQTEQYDKIPLYIDAFDSLNLLIKQDIEVISYDALELPFQRKIEALCNIGIIKTPKFFPIKQSDIQKNHENISKALALIKKVDPIYYDEMNNFLDAIILIRADHVKAGSSVDMLGMFFLEVTYIDDPINMAEVLIHELSHMYLHFLNVKDALILNDPQDLFESPFRKEQRPMMGVFHATFVAARITHFFQKIKTSGILPEQLHSIKEKISSNKQCFEKCFPIVKKYAQTTNTSQNIINTLPQLIAS